MLIDTYFKLRFEIFLTQLVFFTRTCACSALRFPSSQGLPDKGVVPVSVEFACFIIALNIGDKRNV